MTRIEELEERLSTVQRDREDAFEECQRLRRRMQDLERVLRELHRQAKVSPEDSSLRVVVINMTAEPLRYACPTCGKPA